MIKFSAQNVLVHSVSAVIEIESRNGGQPFQKRELILDDSWDKDGRHYPNFVLVEFTGEKMAQLDGLYPGARVNVEGMLNGREYNNRIYNTVKGLSVNLYQAQQPQQYSAPPMPGGYPQQTPPPQYQQAPAYQAAPIPGGYPQQQAPAYPQQPQQPQQYAPAPQPAASVHRNPGPGTADLPFTPQ